MLCCELTLLLLPLGLCTQTGQTSLAGQSGTLVVDTGIFYKINEWELVNIKVYAHGNIRSGFKTFFSFRFLYKCNNGWSINLKPLTWWMISLLSAGIRSSRALCLSSIESLSILHRTNSVTASLRLSFKNKYNSRVPLNFRNENSKIWNKML